MIPTLNGVKISTIHSCLSAFWMHFIQEILKMVSLRGELMVLLICVIKLASKEILIM
jgi:hypothetical protein